MIATISKSISRLRLKKNRRITAATLMIFCITSPQQAEAEQPKHQQPGAVQTTGHIPTTSNLQMTFNTYKDNQTGISFVYPKGWKENQDRDKNCLIKFCGATADGANGEIALNKYDDAPDNTRCEQVKKFMDDFVYPKLQNFKRLQDQRVAIGPNRKIPAFLEDVSFTMAGMNFQQRAVFFDTKSGRYSLMMTSPAATFNSLTPIYNHVLLNLRTLDARETAAGLNGKRSNKIESAANSVKLSPFQSSITPVTFSYPDDWSVQETGNKNEPIIIKGKNADGIGAQINLYRGDMHPWFTLENMADSLEKEFFEAQKSFRRVSRQQQNFGNLSKVNGIIQENSFENNGAHVKQMVAMFSHNDKCYALCIYAPNWKENDMRLLFNKMLATVQVQE